MTNPRRDGQRASACRVEFSDSHLLVGRPMDASAVTWIADHAPASRYAQRAGRVHRRNLKVEQMRKEMGHVEFILAKEKETPGTWRYKEKKDDRPMAIYLTKEQVKELGNPDSIKVTITAA